MQLQALAMRSERTQGAVNQVCMDLRDTSVITSVIISAPDNMHSALGRLVPNRNAGQGWRA